MDNPRPEGEDKARLARMIDSLLYASPEDGVDLCFSFDTTGSMYSCLEKVRANITQTVTKLMVDIPNLRVAIIAHGDYCDDHPGSYVIEMLDFCTDVKQITKFVNGVKCTGGGDLPEAYELALRDAQKLKWRLRSAKALVMIGDSPPHPASYTSEKVWWRDELSKLYRELGCKVYAVQAGNYANSFYQELARRSGGVHLPLESFNLITEMFMAVCYKERGVDYLKRFKQELQKDKRLNASLDKVFNKLEHETPPPALGAENSDWWDTSRDKGLQQYRLDEKTKRFVNAEARVKVVKKGDEGSYETAIRAERAATEANTPAFSTRTGGSILDPSRMLKKDPAKSKPDWTPASDDPYTVRRVRGCIFEIVAKSALSTEERERLEAAQPPPPVPPSKTGKALALIVTDKDRKVMATKRLMRDMAEVHRHPVHNVAAAPLEADIFKWHCSLAGPAGSAYADVVFHLTMDFPINYPKKPPRVMICSTLIHPSVFGKWVCLDMLELGGWSAEEEGDRMFTGWSSGYSVLSILLQLQAFLFEGAMSEPHFVTEAAKRAKAFVCPDCGHNKGGKVYPPLPNIPPPPVAAVAPKAKAPAKPAKPAAAKSPLIAAPKAAAPLAALSATPHVAPVATPAAAPQVRAMIASLNGLRPGTAIRGTVLRVKEGTGAWVKVGNVPLAFVPATHVSAAFCKNIEDVVKINTSVVVYVLSVDAVNGRLSASLLSDPLMRAFKEQPRLALEEVIVGTPRLGVVERVDRGGALVDFGVRNRVWGRLPLAQATVTPTDLSAHELFTVGEVITCAPTHVDLEARALTLRARIVPRAVVAPTIPVHFIRPTKKSNSASGDSHDAEKAIGGTGFAHLSLEVIYRILERLSPYDVARLGRTCHFFHKLAADGTSYLFERNELVCFHTKLHFSEDVLGVGLNLESKLNGKLAYITTTFDLVSYQAFTTEKIRKASYKEPFTHWLPLFINPSHGARALPLVQESMAKICNDTYGSFEPWMILEVIPKLMNSMVVQVMSGKLYGSIMALEGYSAFHHLLLVLLDVYPELKAKVDDIIRNFLKSDSARHKHEVPALGEWLPLLSVTETFSWEDVATSYLGEMFDRNVLWTLKAHPHLAKWPASDGPLERQARLRKTYDATTVSNHLLMFHVYFLDHVARPAGMSLKHLRELLDIRYGKPTWAMKEALMREVKRIRSFQDWGSFFAYIHVRPPSEPELVEWLRQSQVHSERKRYHRASDFV